jgi:TPP-dependent 2-oxoacid decarboxylase
LQECLSPDTCILAETGDSWFNALKLNLPQGSGFEVQMRYGSIGWSVGATLGYSLAAAADGKRLISMIGDGSFQMTAQVGSWPGGTAADGFACHTPGVCRMHVDRLQH